MGLQGRCGGKYVPGAVEGDRMSGWKEGWRKDRNLSGHSELQRDNRGVDSAGRQRAELLLTPLIRDSGDTPRQDTPTACGTTLGHERALKHPMRYYLNFLFLDNFTVIHLLWHYNPRITKLRGYYYFLYSISQFCSLSLLLGGDTSEKSPWNVSRPHSSECREEGVKRDICCAFNW